MKSKSKFLWYLIAIGFIILFLLMLLSNILDVGERLNKISVYVEYAFYGVVAFLVYFLIIRPVNIILFSPSFSIETTLDKQTRKNYVVYKKVAKRLVLNKQLPEEVKTSLLESMKDREQLKDNLNIVYNKHIKKQINQIIKKHAKTVMISTAISQNGRLDLYTVLVVNIKMVKEIVVICGFRPNMKNLAKLVINVFTTALIAEGLENMNLNDILPNNTMNMLGEIPLIKPVISSVLQGISNALLTLRIGIVTRKYLFSDAKEVTKDEIRRGALLEATGMLPSVVADTITMFPKKFFGLFKKNSNKEDDSNKQSL